ncbi:1-phosphofructokinase family hexose kinase [Pendulispora rubella]|uniref:1-phosphofructokinase family hexose kinase n=1 Tax=Pendulispora rubella TaxID=2741070 RepID=A0ABZ2LDT0_9BACT
MITVGGFNTSMDELIQLEELSLGKVHRTTGVQAYPGGKGLHVATGIAALGEPVALVGLIDRGYRTTFEDWLGARGVAFHGIEIEQPIRTCFAIREQSGRITEILEAGPEIDSRIEGELLATFRKLADASRVAVLSGSLPRGISEQTYAKLVESLGTRCIVDASGDPLRHAIAAGPFMVKPNRDEAERWLSMPIDGLEAAAAAAQRMAYEGIALVVVSLGDQGALAFSHGVCLHASVEIDACINPVGSGDALVGGMTVGLARDWSFEATFRLGVACGAANALTGETGFFRREDVEKLFPLVKVRTFPFSR